MLKNGCCKPILAYKRSQEEQEQDIQAYTEQRYEASTSNVSLNFLTG